MHQKGIFLKIYLIFWLISFLVLVTQISLDKLTNSGPFNLKRHPMVEILTAHGQTLAALLCHNDAPAIASVTSDLQRTKGIRLTLVDASDNSVAGNELNPEQRAAAREARQTGQAVVRQSGDNALHAVPFVTPGGTSFVVLSAMRATDHRPPHPDPTWMAVRLMVVLLISGVFCYLLSRYLTAPILALRDATTRLAAGDLMVRVGAGIGARKDELSDLAHDFDRMAERLQSLVNQQRQLMGDISHELRSPLARLNVALDLARRQTGPEALPALNRIEEEAGSLNEMIDQVLTLTRLESGDCRYAMTEVNLAAVVRQIADDGDFEAQGSNRSVRLSSCDECNIFGNEKLLRSAIENVVRNAIHYTKEHTTVEIQLQVQPEDSKAFILVRDHGPGVPANDLSKLLQPFFRVSNARDRQTGGTGLGLAISDRAVHLHGGFVQLSNVKENGLLVTICLPLS